MDFSEYLEEMGYFKEKDKPTKYHSHHYIEILYDSSVEQQLVLVEKALEWTLDRPCCISNHFLGKKNDHGAIYRGTFGEMCHTCSFAIEIITFYLLYLRGNGRTILLDLNLNREKIIKEIRGDN